MKHEPKNNRELVREAIDDCFSGVNDVPSLLPDILRKAQGDIRVKKKLSVGLVLAIVLILMAVTALAVTLTAYYERTIEKEGQSGLIRDWSASEKAELVDLMIEAGAVLDEEKVERLRGGNLSEEQRGELAMELISGYYPARDGILTSIDIIAKEKGAVEYWSLEDKAWLSEMLAKYQPEEVVYNVNLLPTEGDITREQAIEVMYAYFEKEYGLKREAFDESRMAISFSEGVWGEDAQRLKAWSMDLWLKGEYEYPMGISILADGTVKEARGPYTRSWRDDWYDTFMAEDFWTIEGQYRFKQEWTPIVERVIANGEKLPSDLKYLIDNEYALPTEKDITRDEAYAIAKSAVLSAKGWTEEKLRSFTTREAYRVDDADKPMYWFAFVWSIASEEERAVIDELHQNGEIPRRVIVKVDSVNGEVISVEENNRVDPEGRLGM